jgi:hypothetical protein
MTTARYSRRLVLRAMALAGLMAVILLLPLEVSAARKKKRLPGVSPITRDYAKVIKWILVVLFGPMLVYFFYSIASDPMLPSLLWRAMQRLGNRMYGYLGDGRGQRKAMTSSSSTSSWDNAGKSSDRLDETYANKFEGHLYPRPVPPQPRQRRTPGVSQFAPAAGPMGGELGSQWRQQRQDVTSARSSRRVPPVDPRRHVHFE